MFPTPHTVEHLERAVTGENALGQITTSHVSRTRSVYGWQPRLNTDGKSADLADRVITELLLLAPEGDWADGDKVVIPGRGEFVVHGEPEDFTTGPFGFTPGYRVTLRKVTDGGP